MGPIRSNVPFLYLFFKVVVPPPPLLPPPHFNLFFFHTHRISLVLTFFARPSILLMKTFHTFVP